MIKIINGKRYNTLTAMEIATASGGGYATDFRHWEETLYLTPKGAWFLVGKGNAMSQYAEFCMQNSWGPGTAVVVLSEDQAYEWLEKNEEVDLLEEHFASRLSDA